MGRRSNVPNMPKEKLMSVEELKNFKVREQYGPSKGGPDMNDYADMIRAAGRAISARKNALKKAGIEEDFGGFESPNIPKVWKSEIGSDGKVHRVKVVDEEKTNISKLKNILYEQIKILNDKRTTASGWKETAVKAINSSIEDSGGDENHKVIYVKDSTEAKRLSNKFGFKVNKGDIITQDGKKIDIRKISDMFKAYREWKDKEGGSTAGSPTNIATAFEEIVGNREVDFDALYTRLKKEGYIVKGVEYSTEPEEIDF